MQSPIERTAVLSRADVCRWLPDFLAVVEAGSVKDAARALGKSASSIERSIVLIEREIGSRVFERPRRNRIVLTPVGALLLESMGDRLRELAGAMLPPIEESRPAPSTARPKAMSWVDEEAERRRRARQWPRWVSAT